MSGDIRSIGDAPTLAGRTASGRIAVFAGSLTAELSTVSGDVEVKAGALAKLELKTICGDIVVQGRFDPQGRFDLETKAGDVRIVHPANAPTRFSFKTISGVFESEGVPITRAGRRRV